MALESIGSSQVSEFSSKSNPEGSVCSRLPEYRGHIAWCFSDLRFVSSTYLPQLLCILAVIAPFAALVFMLLIVQWVAFGWIAGLVGIALTYALAVCTPLGREQASFIDDWATERNETLAMYIGAELVPAKGSKDSEGRPMMIAGTKLVLENMLQLMLQTSYLSLSFDRMDDTARIQALASLFVGIAVSALKGGQIVAVVGPESWSAL